MLVYPCWFAQSTPGDECDMRNVEIEKGKVCVQRYRNDQSDLGYPSIANGRVTLGAEVRWYNPIFQKLVSSADMVSTLMWS